MRLPSRLLAFIALPLALAGCTDTPTRPVGTPIDCSTLATSLATTTDLTTTASGLRYRDQVVGTGLAAAAGNLVALHYAGCLTSGAVFDQNLDVDQALVFQVGAGGIIAGFDEGVRGMKVGGTRQLVIPPSLGYGSTAVTASDGRVIIPANSTIVFTVVLVAVK